MGISDILHIARSGLMVAQTGQRVTGHNITNANTPGFSRQRVTVSALGGNGYLPGIGVSVANIHRVHDRFLENQANLHRGVNGFLDGQYLVAQQLETVLNEVGNTGINNAMNEFFNAFRELTNNSSDMAVRQLVALRGEQLSDRISTAFTNFEAMQDDLNLDVESVVDEANGLIQEIAKMNGEISTYEDVTGRTEASDLLDQRDELVRQLHALVDITTFTDDNGSINVMLANHSIVEGVSAGSLGVLVGPMYRIEMTTVGQQAHDITDDLTHTNGRGKLSGILYERDVTIEDLKGGLDLLAYNLVDRINSIHLNAFGLDGNSGRAFFTPIAAIDGAAKLLEMNQDIIDNPDWIAAALDGASAHGDNRAAVAIADLQSDRTTLGTVTYQEHYNDMVGSVSAHLTRINGERDFQQSVMDQSEAYRESVSGVSIDEEMVSMIQYQRAFEASARMITTADEMLQTVIGMVR